MLSRRESANGGEKMGGLKDLKNSGLRLSRMPGPLGQVRAMALPGKFERNRGGETMNWAKSRVLWARISPIQAISLPRLKWPQSPDHPLITNFKMSRIFYRRTRIS